MSKKDLNHIQNFSSVILALYQVYVTFAKQWPLWLQVATQCKKVCQHKLPVIPDQVKLSQQNPWVNLMEQRCVLMLLIFQNVYSPALNFKLVDYFQISFLTLLGVFWRSDPSNLENMFGLSLCHYYCLMSHYVVVLSWDHKKVPWAKRLWASHGSAETSLWVNV